PPSAFPRGCIEHGDPVRLRFHRRFVPNVDLRSSDRQSSRVDIIVAYMLSKSVSGGFPCNEEIVEDLYPIRRHIDLVGFAVTDEGMFCRGDCLDSVVGVVLIRVEDDLRSEILFDLSQIGITRREYDVEVGFPGYELCGRRLVAENSHSVGSCKVLQWAVPLS